MSDIYAANAVPVWAMASVTLAAACRYPAITPHTVDGRRAGGAERSRRTAGWRAHRGSALGVGYAVTGWREAPPLMPMSEEIALLLTKPLGSGVIMAAHMKLAATASG